MEKHLIQGAETILFITVDNFLLLKSMGRLSSILGPFPQSQIKPGLFPLQFLFEKPGKLVLHWDLSFHWRWKREVIWEALLCYPGIPYCWEGLRCWAGYCYRGGRLPTLQGATAHLSCPLPGPPVSRVPEDPHWKAYASCRRKEGRKPF